jgi:hypothetical protein
MVALLGRRPFDTRDEMDDLLDKQKRDQPHIPLCVFQSVPLLLFVFPLLTFAGVPLSCRPDENTPAGRDSTPGAPTLEPGSLPSM